MKTWVRRSLNAGALTAGALLATGAAAQASPTMLTTDNTGLLNGTQALVPIQAPINVCGNAIGVAGNAIAGCEGGATALNPEWRFSHFRDLGSGSDGHFRDLGSGSDGRGGAGPTMTSTDNLGVLNGTQVYAPVQVPVNVCGNAVAVAGAAGAECEGGATAILDPGKPDHGKPGYGKPDHGKPGYGKPVRSKHEDGAPAHGTSPALMRSGGPGSGTSHGGSATTMVTSGNLGILNGTQVLVPIQVPVDVCGNAVAVLGIAGAGCEGGATAIG